LFRASYAPDKGFAVVPDEPGWRLDLDEAALAAISATNFGAPVS
jgi:L-alanine-DL-glutamate epimerase-like enolase superfamily enzyme